MRMAFELQMVAAAVLIGLVHLGWAAAKLGFKVRSPVFDSPSEETIRSLLKEAGLPEDG